MNFEDLVGTTLEAEDERVWMQHAQWTEQFLPLLPGKFEDSLGGVPGRLFERFYRLIQAEPWDRALDFGCGVAPFREYFRPHRYVGLDRNPYAIDLARKHWPDTEFVFHAGCPLPFGDGEFDLVTAIGVFEHINDEHLSPILSELYRISHRGGRLLMWEETKYDPPYRSAVYGRFPYEWESLATRYGYRTLWQQGQQHVFRVV